MALMIAGTQFWLWRSVDDEDEVLDLLVQRQRDKAAAVKLMRKLLKKQADRAKTPGIRGEAALLAYFKLLENCGASLRHAGIDCLASGHYCAQPPFST